MTRSTVADGVVHGAVMHPDRPALVEAGGAVRRYRELDERTDRLAHALRGAGLGTGDRLAIWLGNRIEYLETYLACAKAGIVVVPINVRYTAPEAAHILGDSGAAGLVFGPEVTGRVEELGVLGELRFAACVGAGPATALETVVASGAATPMAPPDEDALLIIGYTSGTTGLPKGAELTHRSVAHLGRTNQMSCRYAIGSVQVFGMSMSFTATVPAHLLPHLSVGGTSVLLPAWDTERLVAEIERYCATFVILPSPPVREFADLVERAPSRVASLVSVLHSASKAPPADLARLVDVIGPRLVEGWGMTENSGGLLTATAERDYLDRGERVFDEAGRAVPGTLVRVVDTDGAELPCDGETIGLLVARSPAAARGYWKNPAATEATFGGGWLRTGDLGSIDPDGYVRIVDRRHDLIVSGGMNVYPSEIERVLATAPGVARAAVVPVPHPRWGQTPVAFVVPARPGALDTDSVLAHCRERLASYKLPSTVLTCAELPYSTAGKLQRAELAAIALEATTHPTR